MVVKLATRGTDGTARPRRDRANAGGGILPEVHGLGTAFASTVNEVLVPMPGGPAAEEG
jgi:hypothetical protein